MATTKENFIKQAAFCRQKIKPLPAALASMLAFAEDNLDLYDSKMGLEEWNTIIGKMEGAGESAGINGFEEHGGLGRLETQHKNVEVSDALDKVFSIMDTALDEGGYAPKGPKKAVAEIQDLLEHGATKSPREKALNQISAVKIAIKYLKGEKLAAAAQKLAVLETALKYLKN